MQLHTLKRRTKNIKTASVGRGGKRGKTSGRGTKGQKARSGHKIRPEIRDVIKRLPKLRGRGKNSNLSIEIKPTIVTLSIIEKKYENGEVVNIPSLAEKKIISIYKGKMPVIKVLSGKKDEKFSKKVSLSGVKISQGAKKLIEDAGGKIE